MIKRSHQLSKYVVLFIIICILLDLSRQNGYQEFETVVEPNKHLPLSPQQTLFLGESMMLLAPVIFISLHVNCVLSAYRVDDTLGLGRKYDGIGGLSGGSGTSKLLKAYPEKQRNEILDYLFKPRFGASLQILKVEIGGDSQSSDAVESSHMHFRWDENYERGYEWWLMEEAKRINPNIKLYGLPWNFPGWIGNGTQNPYTDIKATATYITNWIKGARDSHNLTIDYIGIWNERSYSIPYIKLLRQTLDSSGFTNVRIVASDNRWTIADDILKDAELAASIDYIGAHYPGTETVMNALETGKTLWSSEDYSTFNNNVGAGCWARILNQNYVNGFMTSTIAWNLIDSYYEGLTWDGDSLMTARQPWSGYYEVTSPIWMSAHTTQFTEIGWTYLPHGSGVGHLDMGGSYVSLVSPDKKELTIVIETMSHDHSACIRPALPAYNVTSQNITFSLAGSFAGIKELNVWYSKLGFNGAQSIFLRKSSVQVTGGQVTLSVGVDEAYTLTTLTSGQKGDYGSPPPPKTFPLPYMEHFENYDNHSEPLLLAQQNGVFEVIHIDSFVGNVMRQMVLESPVVWCPEFDYHNSTMTVFGSANWSTVYLQTEVIVSEVNGTDGVYLAARINSTGCSTYSAAGIFFHFFPVKQTYIISQDLERKVVLASGNETQASQFNWNKIALLVQEKSATVYINGDSIFNVQLPPSPSVGFAGVGTSSYGIADFDNLIVAENLNQAENLKGLYKSHVKG